MYIHWTWWVTEAIITDCGIPYKTTYEVNEQYDKKEILTKIQRGSTSNSYLHRFRNVNSKLTKLLTWSMIYFIHSYQESIERDRYSLPRLSSLLPGNTRLGCTDLPACATVLENESGCKLKGEAVGIASVSFPLFPRLMTIGMASLTLNTSCYSASTLSKHYSTAAGRAKFMFAYIVEKPWVSSAWMIPHDEKSAPHTLPSSLPPSLLCSSFFPAVFFLIGFGNFPNSCSTFSVIVFKINISNIMPPFLDLYPLFSDCWLLTYEPNP